MREPATGRYVYAVDGWEKTTAPGSHRRFPDTASVVVHERTETAKGTTFTVDLAYSDDHVERAVVRYGRQGLHVTFEGGRVVFFGGAVTETSQAEYHPPVLRTPYPARVGQRWSGTTEARRPQDGSRVRRESYHGRVVGTETVRVAGRPVDTVVVEWRSQFSGQEQGWREQKLWFSPRLGIWVKVHDRVHGERFNFAYDKNATLTLRRLPR